MNNLVPSLEKIQNKGDLEKWLNSNKITESYDWEFKKMVRPAKNNKEEKDRLCNSFSAFANTCGGCIFFGIVDGTKEVVGVKKENDFPHLITTKIEQISPCNIDWRLINEVDVGNGLYVYIVFIEESKYGRKPHVYNYRVHVRRNGNSVPVSTSEEMRGIISCEKFVPTSKSTMDYVFNKIKKHEELCIAETSYVILLQKHLKHSALSSHHSEDFKTLLSDLENLLEDYEKAMRMQKKSTTVKEIVEGRIVNDVSKSLNTLQDFYEKIDRFILNYNRLHKI